MITRKKLNKSDWFKLGLETLERYGINKVNVEFLARELGVTKGSFYWHFKNRNTFLEAMLNYWAENLTTNVIERSAQDTQDAKQILLNLLTIITDENTGRYESAIRTWANHSQVVQPILRHVDKQRLNFVQDKFIEMGFAKEDAEIRARLVLYYQVAETSIFLNDTKAKRKQLLLQRIELLTRQ